MPCTHALSVRLRVIGHVWAEVNVLKKIKQGKAVWRRCFRQEPRLSGPLQDRLWDQRAGITSGQTYSLQRAQLWKESIFPPFPDAIAASLRNLGIFFWGGFRKWKLSFKICRALTFWELKQLLNTYGQSPFPQGAYKGISKGIMMMMMMIKMMKMVAISSATS